MRTSRRAWPAAAFAVLLLASSPAAAEEPARGWIGIGGRNAFGLSAPVNPDFGAYLLGGMWILDEHLQPYVRAGWSRGGGKGVVIDTVRVGGGAALGAAALHERLWLGGAVGAEAVSALSHGDLGSGTSWVATFDFSAVVQGRFGERLLLGVEFGPEIASSSLEFAGSQGTVEWNALRFNAGLRIGVILGDPIGR